MEYNNDYSLRGEKFMNIPLTWRLGVSNIEIVKIRLASWTPKSDRSNQAVYYYDCRTDEEVEKSIKEASGKPIKKIKELFEKLFLEYIGKGQLTCTGDTQKFLKNIFLPQARALKL